MLKFLIESILKYTCILKKWKNIRGCEVLKNCTIKLKSKKPTYKLVQTHMSLTFLRPLNKWVSMTRDAPQRYIKVHIGFNSELYTKTRAVHHIYVLSCPPFLIIASIIINGYSLWLLWEESSQTRIGQMKTYKNLEFLVTVYTIWESGAYPNK